MKFIQNIIDKNLIEAKKEFDFKVASLVESKLEEKKKMISAFLYEAKKDKKKDDEEDEEDKSKKTVEVSKKANRSSLDNVAVYNYLKKKRKKMKLAAKRRQ
jgi:hypothetical protein